MVKSWLRFAFAWLACLAFYLVYRGWMSWVVLLSASCLPLFSLVVSLPAMLLSRFTVSVPDAVAPDVPAIVDVRVKCVLPMPIWRLRIEARHVLTGQKWRLKPGNLCPTEHCGAVYFHFRGGRVYDYMGLFFIPKKAPADVRMIVRPKQVSLPNVSELDKRIVVYWRPKAGGGFSENHELRLYRPGDSLRQIHWKLSGKTGKLIYREPMERVNSRLVLHLIHGGDAAQLDRKLGRLLWLGSYLHRQELAYDVEADTVEGWKSWRINTWQDLLGALDGLLCIPPLPQGELQTPVSGLGRFYIGGDSDETQ